MAASIDMVPEEVLIMIFSYLSYDDLVSSVQEVCTFWRQVSRNKTLWKHHIYTPSKDSSNKEVMHWLKKSPKLQAVDLSDIVVSKKVIKVLCNTCTYLRVLQFHANQKLDLELVKQLLTCCPNVEELWVPDKVFCDVAKFRSLTGYEHLKLLKIKREPPDLTKFMRYVEGMELKVFQGAESFNVLANAFPNLIELNLEEAVFTLYDLELVLENKQDQLETLNLPCLTSDKECVLPLVTQCSKLKFLILHIICRSFDRHLPKLPSSLKNVTLVQANFEKMYYCDRLFEIFSQVSVFKFSLCCGPCNHLIETIALQCPAVEKLIFYGCMLVMTGHNLASLTLMPELKSLVVIEDLDVNDKVLAFLSDKSELVEIEINCCANVTLNGLKILLSMPKLEILKYDLLFGKYKPSDFHVETVARSVKNLKMQVLLYGCGYVPYTQLKSLRRLLPDLQLTIVNGRFARLPPDELLVTPKLILKEEFPIITSVGRLLNQIGSDLF